MHATDHSRVLDLVCAIHLEPGAKTAECRAKNALKIHEIIIRQRDIVSAERDHVLKFNATTGANMVIEARDDGASDEEVNAFIADMRLCTERIMNNFMTTLNALDAVGTETLLEGAVATARQTERDRVATSVASASAFAKQRIK